MESTWRDWVHSGPSPAMPDECEAHLTGSLPDQNRAGGGLSLTGEEKNRRHAVWAGWRHSGGGGFEEMFPQRPAEPPIAPGPASRRKRKKVTAKRVQLLPACLGSGPSEDGARQIEVRVLRKDAFRT
jgi:hypothetical protein